MIELEIFGKKLTEYLAGVWPYLLASFMLGILEYFLFKYEFLDIQSLNLTNVAWIILLLILGIFLHFKGYSRSQAAFSSFLCLLSEAWNLLFFIPAQGTPLVYTMINLLIIFTLNLLLYAALSILGWYIGRAIVSKSKYSQKPVRSRSRRRRKSRASRK